MALRLHPLLAVATVAALVTTLPVTTLAAPASDGPPVQVAGSGTPTAAPAASSAAPAATDPSAPSVRELPSADAPPAAEPVVVEGEEELVEADAAVVADATAERSAASGAAGSAASPYFGPPGAERMDRVAPEHNRNRGLGLTVAGYTLFGAFYLISAGMGTMAIDGAFAWSEGGGDDWDAQRRETFGKRLTIPVAGPFLAVPYADTATGGLATAMLGVFQVAGLTLGTVGAVRLGKSRREHRFAMGVSPTPDGGFGTVRLRF